MWMKISFFSTHRLEINLQHSTSLRHGRSTSTYLLHCFFTLKERPKYRPMWNNVVGGGGGTVSGKWRKELIVDLDLYSDPFEPNSTSSEKDHADLDLRVQVKFADLQHVNLGQAASPNHVTTGEPRKGKFSLKKRKFRILDRKKGVWPIEIVT